MKAAIYVEPKMGLAQTTTAMKKYMWKHWEVISIIQVNSIMFPLGVLWAWRLIFYRKCVFCIHKEVSAACLCVVVYSYEWVAAFMLGIRD